MPWRETSAMDERLRFVQDVHRPGWSIAELCRRYEVSRKTGYKWLLAYERGSRSPCRRRAGPSNGVRLSCAAVLCLS
jgi:transposase-like protein